MGIFQDAQRQLTLQSNVESGPYSNLSEILWLSSLPGSKKKIQSTSSPKGNDRSPENKQVFLNSSQLKIFFNWSRAANSAVHA